MLKISHRGALGPKVENTVQSFKEAISLGCDMIETDIRLTKDKQIVCVHDADIKRLTGKKLRVKDLLLKDLRQIPLNGTGRINTLSQVLNVLDKKTQINIEIKEMGLEKQLISLLRKRGLVKRAIISSFYSTPLKSIKNICPSIRTGILIPWRGRIRLDFAKDIGCYSVHPHVLRVKKSCVDKSHSLGLKVFPYTVNTEKKMNLLIAWGVDGLITDNLPRLNSVLKEFEKSHIRNK